MQKSETWWNMITLIFDQRFSILCGVEQSTDDLAIGYISKTFFRLIELINFCIFKII